MSTDDDLKRRLTDFYAGEGTARAPDRVLESSLAAIEDVPQRRGLARVPGLLQRRNPYVGLLVAAVVVIAVGALGLALFRPAVSPRAGATPSPSPPAGAILAPSASPTASLTASPAPTPPPIPSPDANSLAAGRYRLAAPFPVPVSYEVTDGWSACSAGPLEQIVCLPASFRSGGSVSFLIVANVVTNPCTGALARPPVGPSIDDLVTAISDLQGFSATAPEDVTVDGYAGKALEVTAPTNSPCDLRTWATHDRTNGVGSGELNVIRIFDVDGVRVFIAGAYFPAQDPPGTRAAINEVLDSVQIGPDSAPSPSRSPTSPPTAVTAAPSPAAP